MGLKLDTAPAEEPVTLDEAKEHCRVYDAAEDFGLSTRISAARRWCEHFTFRQFVEATWLLGLDHFPRRFLLPKPPLLTVEELSYVDGDGATVVMDPSDYRVDTIGEPGVVEPVYGTSWPSARRVSGSVRVLFTSGYGAAADVPEDIKAAILILTADLHKEREDTVVGASVATIDAAKRLLWPHRCLAAQLEYARMEAA